MLVFQSLSGLFILRLSLGFWLEMGQFFLFETLSFCTHATTHKDAFQPLQGIDEEDRLAPELLAKLRHR